MEYNKQKEEILALEGNILVQASAGSGKTTLLIDETQKLVKQGKENLLILTFSNNAVNEIKERLSEIMDCSKITISTIHSFCFSIIKENLILTEFNREPSVISEKQTAEVLIKIFSDIFNDVDAFNYDSNVINSMISYFDTYSLNNTKENLLLDLYSNIESNSSIETTCKKTMVAYSSVSSAFVQQQVSFLCDILTRAKTEYSKYKLQNNLIDFNDMEKITLNLLDSSLKDKYADKFDYILVDEYQDTSEFQEKIINILSNGNLFCVGDLKQSIYGFRAASPEILKKRQDSYSDETNGYSRFLTSNYRSCKNIIDFTNDVFSQHEDASGFFSKSANLVYARANKEEKCEPIHLITPIDTGDKKISQVLKITEIIKNNLGKSFFDSKTNTVREAKYSDFLVLFRNLNPYKDVILQEFKNNQIPFSINQTSNLLNEPEIKTFISLLRAYCFHTDIDILNIFHKGLFSLNDDLLCELKNGSFTTDLYHLIENSDDIRFKQIKDFLIQDRSGSLLPELSGVIRDSNFQNWLENFNIKEISLENFQAFMFECCNLSIEHPDWQLIDLVIHLDYLNENKIKIKAPDFDFEDSVVISTIHGSKGSEKPFVIIAAADSSFSFTSPPISFNKDLGLGIKYYNIDKLEYSSTPQKNEIDELLKFNHTEEELRLLYVAITRAREELFIIGDFNKKYKTINNFCAFIKQSLDNNSQNNSTFLTE